MPLRIIDHGSAEYKQMIDLRYALLRKPLSLKFEPEELEKEKNDILIGCFDDDHLAGCCLLTQIDNNSIRLRQMAVLSGLQGKGIGRAIMQFCENIARDLGYKKISMHARKTAVGFYEKLGYKIIGEAFHEVTLEHFVMEKNLF